jgi:hypothetical protein
MGITTGPEIPRGRNGTKYIVSDEINIDSGGSSHVYYTVLVPEVDIFIESARVIYTEATDTAGADSATVSVGIASGGVTIVAATALGLSKAIGSYTALVLATQRVPANSPLIVTHNGIAATEGGKYKVQFRYRIAA